MLLRKFSSCLIILSDCVSSIRIARMISRQRCDKRRINSLIAACYSRHSANGSAGQSTHSLAASGVEKNGQKNDGTDDHGLVCRLTMRNRASSFCRYRGFPRNHSCHRNIRRRSAPLPQAFDGDILFFSVPPLILNRRLLPV